MSKTPSSHAPSGGGHHSGGGSGNHQPPAPQGGISAHGNEHSGDHRHGQFSVGQPQYQYFGGINYNGDDNYSTTASGQDLPYKDYTAGAAHGAGSASGKDGSKGGWFDGIIKQFYDEKDGFKLGGFAGALGGALLGMNFLGTGSWLGILGMGVMTLAGAWGGNKISGAVSSFVSSHTGSGEPEKNNTPGHTRTLAGGEAPKPLDEHAKQLARDAVAARGETTANVDKNQMGIGALPVASITNARPSGRS